jgi:hypothetical protein
MCNENLELLHFSRPIFRFRSPIDFFFVIRKHPTDFRVHRAKFLATKNKINVKIIFDFQRGLFNKKSNGTLSVDVLKI